MNFGDFTESTGPSATDFLAGYATGGGAGSDRRYQVGNLLTALTSVEIKGSGDVKLELGRIDGNASNPAIHFHSGATALDYDSALVATGGASGSPTAAGEGSLQFVGAGGLNPAINDGAPLGTGSLSWSDLSLASGGVINFANSDFTITHATGGITFAVSNTTNMLSLQQNDSGAQGAIINLFHNSGSVAVNDRLGGVFVQGRNSTPATVTFAKMAVDLAVNTASSESGAWVFETIQSGAFAERFRVAISPIAYNGTAIPAGGDNRVGYKATSTANFGVYFGSGNPTLSAAKGSLYLKSNGTTTNDRAYINTDGGTTWTALTTAA